MGRHTRVRVDQCQRSTPKLVVHAIRIKAISLGQTPHERQCRACRDRPHARPPSRRRAVPARLAYITTHNARTQADTPASQHARTRAAHMFSHYTACAIMNACAGEWIIIIGCFSEWKFHICIYANYECARVPPAASRLLCTIWPARTHAHIYTESNKHCI